MKNILSDKSFKTAIILTLVFLSVGFLFLLFDIAQFSWVLFVLLPIVLGISIGALPNKKWAIYGAIVALVCFLVLLVIGQLEGMLCVLMAIPILQLFQQAIKR